MVQQWVVENIGLVAGVIVFILVMVGLVIALQTEGGRNSLAAAAVKVAMAALALAEAWLRGEIESQKTEAWAHGLAVQENEIELAQKALRLWLESRRSDGG